MEEWKDIEGYPNYMVSNMGRVKRLSRSDTRGRIIKEKILKQIKNRCGYFRVNLYKDGKNYKSKTIHRLVAQAFIPNPDNFPQVNHIDENKENNCVSNLEFCTAEYNNTYGSRLEKSAKSKSIPIL